MLLVTHSHVARHHTIWLAVIEQITDISMETVTVAIPMIITLIYNRKSKTYDKA